ncbi:MAG: 50S ribosomal protein L15 [Candidatus Omnitrophica bacterium]|nr:50S ribosomal protein L15 [Candidatus Omnitrophota bacterium]
MFLHELRAPKGSRIKKVRKGRGPGSGLGKRSGRGDKGQRSRSGRGIILGSEGGQMPLIRRLPKIGFNTLNPIVYQIVQLDTLNCFEAATVVNVEALKKAQLISSLRKPYKILSRGELKKALTVEANAFSADAAEKITKAGGKAVVIGKKEEKPEVKKAAKSKEKKA